MRHYLMWRRLHSQLLLKGATHHDARRRKLALLEMNDFARKKRTFRRKAKEAMQKFTASAKLRCFKVWRTYARNRKFKRRAKLKAELYFERASRERAVDLWRTTAAAQKRAAELKAIALLHFSGKMHAMCFGAWKILKQIGDDKEALATARYLDKLRRKVFFEWKMIQRAVAEIRTLDPELAAKVQSGELTIAAAQEAKKDVVVFQQRHGAISKIQAVWRGKKAREDTEEWRVFQEYAVLKVQAQARVQLAKKRAWRERRYRDLRTYCREEQEQILMEIEDAAAREIMAEERASTPSVASSSATSDAGRPPRSAPSSRTRAAKSGPRRWSRRGKTPTSA